MERVKDEPQACVECELPEFERNNFFCGKLMVERDFWADQHYHMGKQRLHTRYLHGWGTVCGLRVEPHPHCPDRRVIVSPGLAVDCCGRELFVREPYQVELAPLVEALPAVESGTVRTPSTVYLCLRYDECFVEPVPALFTECGCSDERCEPNRIRDAVRFALMTEAQIKEQAKEPDGRVSLEWSHTIPIARPQFVAVDHTRGNLFVVTQSDAATLAAYKTANQLPLLGAVPIGKKPSGIALAESAERLYVATTWTEAGTVRPHAVLVVDLTNLGAATPAIKVARVGTDEAKKGPLALSADAQFLFVGMTDAVKVYQRTAVDAGGAPAAVATVTGLAGVSALAASPDGQWLLVAERDQDRIAVVDLSHLSDATPSATVKATVPVGDEPVSVVVSPDSAFAYVAHAAGKSVAALDLAVVKAGIQAGATPIPEAVMIPPATVSWTPSQLLISPGGRYLFVAADGDGRVLVLDARFLGDPNRNKVAELELIPRPAGLALSPATRSLYVAALGAEADPTAGAVLVIDVREEPCEAIFTKALDDCPECPGDHCVVLAAIEDYAPGADVTEAMIDNQTPYRRFLYSTSLITEVVRCLLERGGSGIRGPAGPKGDPGPKGDAGPDGDPGLGVDSTLTHVTAFNWTHGQMNVTDYLDMLDPLKAQEGFIVAFDREVKFDTVNHQTFLVSVRRTPPDPSAPLGQPWSITNPATKDLPWHEAFVPGAIEPLAVAVNNQCWIDPTTIVHVDLPAPPALRLVKAVRFKPADPANNPIMHVPGTVRIVLKGDFILDKDDRPIDPEHLHRLLPNGTPAPGLGPMQPGPGQACASGDWVPGGDFESWIDVS